MSRPAIEAFALRAVGKAIKGYADSIYVDSEFANVRQRQEETVYHLKRLAEHLDNVAHEVAHEAKISRILECDS